MHIDNDHKQEAPLISIYHLAKYVILQLSLYATVSLGSIALLLRVAELELTNIVVDRAPSYYESLAVACRRACSLPQFPEVTEIKTQ